MGHLVPRKTMTTTSASAKSASDTWLLTASARTKFGTRRDAARSLPLATFAATDCPAFASFRSSDHVVSAVRKTTATERHAVRESEESICVLVGIGLYK